MLYDLLRDKTNLVSLLGQSLLFASLYRSLVGTMTFQTVPEICCLALASLALVVGMVLLCLMGEVLSRAYAVPLSMSIGALLDFLLGSIFGRVSTWVVTIALVCMGLVCIICIFVKGRTGRSPWQEGRAKPMYQTFAGRLFYLGILVVCVGMLIGCLFILHLGGLNKGVSQLGFFVGCALSGLVIVLVTMLLPKAHVEVLVKGVMVFTTAALSLFLVFEPSFTSLLVAALGFCLFVHVVFCELFDYYRYFQFPAALPAGYLTAMLLSLLAGLLLGNLLVLSGSIDDVGAFTVMAMLFVNIATVFGLGSGHNWDEQSLLKTDRDECVEKQRQGSGFWKVSVAGIAADARLTARETEVLELLAKGRNAAYIADRLVISGHTARAHILKIHKKLDIHSDQEILDLVEARVGEMKNR